MPAGPCTGAQRRKLPTGHSSMADRRGTSPPQVFETQGAVGGSRRPARLHETNRAKSFRKVQGGTPHHFASSIFVFFLVRDRLFRSTDPGAWHTRHRHWDVEWVEGRSADDGMSPKALASLGSRSPRTVSHGRQPALRVLRCAPVLRMTAATDRARSPCGPAGKAGPRSTACKCDACEPLRCRGTPSTTPGRDPRVPSRLRAAAMGHPDTKATGRGAGLT